MHIDISNRHPVVGRLLLSLTAGLLLTAQAALAQVANPSVTAVPSAKPGDSSRNYPQFATAYNIARQGYVEKEYFIEGTATRYATPESANATVISSGHAYKTRLLVRQPTSAKRFNGVVIVEWLNVTSGHDLDVLWLSTAEHLMRQGYAYVGVSAQAVGVHAPLTGLKSWSPARYGSLDVTGAGSILDDSLSFDIYSQAIQSVRSPRGVNPLGNLKPRTVLAVGASQSQQYLRRYHNSVEPLARLVDGYLLYLGVGGLLRTDLKPKVIKLDTETDVLLLGQYAARQPDSGKLRGYEVAGASHVGYSNPNPRAPILERDGLPIPDYSVCTLPALSHIPTAQVARAALDHLTRWVSKGTPPPTAKPIEVIAGSSPVSAVRDSVGNAKGGIRLAEHEVATATNTGLNSGPGYCLLNGSHVPFDDATLRTLYGSPGKYVHQVTHVTLRNLKAGYITAPDAVDTITDAVKREVAKRKR
jgi:hypothetical protein